METVPLDLTISGIEALSNLLRVVGPTAHHLTVDYLTWLYRDNPLGFAYGFNAHEGGELLGHYAAIPVTANVNGMEERGVLSLNTAVHPSARGKGLFKALAALTYEHAAEQGVTFVVGVGNQNSTPLFQRQLKFQLVTPLEARIGVGRGCEKPSLNAPLAFERTWSRETLLWRLARPGNPYRIRNLRGKSIVYSPTGKPTLYAEMGCFDQGLLPSSLGRLICCNPVRLWIGLDPYRSWSKTLTIPLPERFRTSPLNLIFKDLTGEKRILAKDLFRFSLLDFDAW